MAGLSCGVLLWRVESVASLFEQCGVSWPRCRRIGGDLVSVTASDGAEMEPDLAGGDEDCGPDRA